MPRNSLTVRGRTRDICTILCSGNSSSPVVQFSSSPVLFSSMNDKRAGCRGKRKPLQNRNSHFKSPRKTVTNTPCTHLFTCRRGVFSIHPCASCVDCWTIGLPEAKGHATHAVSRRVAPHRVAPRRTEIIARKAKKNREKESISKMMVDFFFPMLFALCNSCCRQHVVSLCNEINVIPGTSDGVKRTRERESVRASHVPVIARSTERSNSPGVSSVRSSRSSCSRLPSRARRPIAALRPAPTTRACRSRFSCAATAAHETASSSPLFLSLSLSLSPLFFPSRISFFIYLPMSPLLFSFSHTINARGAFLRCILI